MLFKYAVASSLLALSAFAQSDSPALENNDPGDTDDILDSPGNFDFTNCAAADEAKSCWKPLGEDEHGYSKETCSQYQDNVNCILTNCWNRVYSCDYQRLMLGYQVSCASTSDDYGYDDSDENTVFESILNVTTPFYPAPDTANVEACSCNLGKVGNVPLELGIQMFTCQKQMDDAAEQAGQDSPDTYPECYCCFGGAYLAGVNDICPTTDLKYFDLQDMQSLYLNQSTPCPDLLKNFSCTDHGITDYGANASAWAGLTLSVHPTGSITDLAGAITTPVSGATYTWTGVNSTFTITAASVEAMATKSVAVTGTPSGTGSAGKSGTKTGATSSASPSSAGGKMQVGRLSFVAMVGFAGLAIAVL